MTSSKIPVFEHRGIYDQFQIFMTSSVTNHVHLIDHDKIRRRIESRDKKHNPLLLVMVVPSINRMTTFKVALQRFTAPLSRGTSE